MTAFSPTWTHDPGDENYTLSVPEVDVFGVGATKEAAIESLIETAQDYATLYFDNVKFYVSVGRESHGPYLQLIASCDGDHKKIREVLGL